MHPEDWPDVERILRLGLASGSASLETTPPTWERWDAEHLTAHRWVAMNGTEIAGWSALGFPHRTVAAGVAESSVYVDAAHRRCGIGSVLLLKLIDESERAGLWTIEARIL